MPTASAPPAWLAPLLGSTRGAPRDAAARRRRAAAAALDAAAPWDDVRRALAGSILVEPGPALAAVAALRAEAEARGDDVLAARLRALEARGRHRVGPLEEAVATYEDAARRLRRARLPQEATVLGISRVDALATAGRIPAALRLAARVARALKDGPAHERARLEVNRGNALRLRGDADEALAAFRRAEAALLAAGAAHDASIARLNAGVALVEAGDAEEALAVFEAGARDFEARGLVDLAREARANAAYATMQAGRLGAAIRALEGLAEEHAAAGLPRREALARTDLAAALLRAGDATGAERQATRAAGAFRAADARAERAEALLLAATAAGRSSGSAALARAQAHLVEARRAAHASERPVVTMRCDLLAADLLLRAGRRPSAAGLASLRRRAEASGQRALATDVLLVAGAAALSRGDAARATTAFRLVRDASAGRPWARIAAETGLASAEARRPAGRARALRRLKDVARFVDAVRSDLPGAWLRASFAAERLDPFLARVELLLARDAKGDRREAAALLDAISARRFLSVRPPAASGGRLGRARRRLEALYDRLARGEGPTRGVETGFAATSALERRARAWERAVAEEWRRRERAEAPAAGEPSAEPATPPLEDDVAAVTLWRRGEDVRALVRIGDAVGPGTTLMSVADLWGFADSLALRARRWALLRDASPAAADPAGAERVLAQIAARVLAPLSAESWPRRVRVVSDPSLPDLPWELLPWGGTRLGALHDVLRVPALALPAARRASVEKGAAGTGSVVVAVGERDLPGVDREVAEVAAAAGAATTLVGERATRAALAEALSTARVVHVAGHGWEATEAPALGGVRVADGWFGATDVPARVACDLVVLAACRTGAARGDGLPAWGGLVPALLAAGARRVLWTTDDVDDRAALALMSRFHGARAKGLGGPSVDEGSAFGVAVRSAADAAGHVGAVLPFRYSGVPS